MRKLDLLRNEITNTKRGEIGVRDYYRMLGLRAHADEPNVIARAHGIASLFREHEKNIYENDLIAGSIYGLFADKEPGPDYGQSDLFTRSFPNRDFGTNADHYAANYATLVGNGIKGTVEKIELSKLLHKDDSDADKRLTFLEAQKITMLGFSDMIRGYGDAAAAKAAKTDEPAKAEQLKKVAETCYTIAWDAPKTFREALQLVWLTHIAFQYEGRGAMAFGRMDQYLFPFFCSDLKKGTITHEEALELIECTLYKIGEQQQFMHCDDVVNIAIGGVKPEDGSDAVNDLSYIILEAVGNCNIPGPNLSARLHGKVSDNFIDACLQVIGTGLGYPALMNDDVNIPALARNGYKLEDARNYCMVGCIENFIQGMQPPWSDGRFNSPKFIEYVFTQGHDIMSGRFKGVKTPELDELDTMDKFLDALVKQMEFGASTYMMEFRTYNERLNIETSMQPFLSCMCDYCIERARDINDGGAYYPSVHGACLMGIATVADSLAVIDKLVYTDRVLTLAQIRDILKVNYEGYEDVRQQFIAVPKYGNNNELPDKYAKWFVESQEKIFDRYRTRDGGAVYTLIASNIQNIPSGTYVGATPDGRFQKAPLSDAASPMHGRDIQGPTSAVLSLSKPDYTMVSGGTVVNQKYSPEMFATPENRAKLAAIIRTYFELGGQEVQINSVSRDTLKDAMEHPENYSSLVVRVSGFSAYYTQLDHEVQEDILERTEHGR